jgi:N-acetylmuramoyl-L-alanine amidase
VTQIRNPIYILVIALLIGGAHSTLGQGTPLPPQVPPVTATPTQPAAPPKPPPAFYRNLIVLDPAHGGRDKGAQLSSSAVEKDVTLAFVQKLRPALVAQGFTVVATRDSDPPDELTTDQRAGTANHLRPLACIMVHVASTGSGVHIFSSSLPETDAKIPPGRALVWNRAQAPVLATSLRLANEVGLTLGAAHLPVLLLRASVPPIDNLLCPAIAVELAPIETASGKATLASDSNYQQRVAAAIASGLASFRTHNAPPPIPTPGSGVRTGVAQ